MVRSNQVRLKTDFDGVRIASSVARCIESNARFFQRLPNFSVLVAPLFAVFFF